MYLITDYQEGSSLRVNKVCNVAILWESGSTRGSGTSAKSVTGFPSKSWSVARALGWKEAFFVKGKYLWDCIGICILYRPSFVLCLGLLFANWYYWSLHRAPALANASCTYLNTPIANINTEESILIRDSNSSRVWITWYVKIILYSVYTQLSNLAGSAKC